MKDPAVLWYWNDWIGGTSIMSRFLKGCYMDVLAAQFNHGPLSLEEVKTVLGSDFGQAWPNLQKKFKKTANGLYFNERMEIEKEKRQKHSERQKENIGKRWNKSGIYQTDTKVIPLENENESRNEVDIGFGKSENLLTDHEIGKTVEYCRITLHRDYGPDRVSELWEAFLINGKKDFYNTQNDIIKHFRNWIKTQPNEPKKGTSEARAEAASKW